MGEGYYLFLIFHIDFEMNLNLPRKTQGLLHFDVTQGCSSETLIAALVDLSVNQVPALDALQKLELDPPAFPAPSSKRTLRFKSPTQNHKRQPIWNRPEKVHTFENLTITTSSLGDFRARVDHAELSPVLSALIHNVLDTLNSFSFDADEATRILKETTFFCALLTELNPLEVSATRLPISKPFSGPIAEAWELVLALVQDLPTFEQEWPAAYSEPLGIALLKTVVSRFGARGESRLLKTGTGIQATYNTPKLVAHALWCEPISIESRTLEGLSALPKAMPLTRVEALIQTHFDLTHLVNQLSNLGAKSICTHPVTEAGTRVRTNLSALLSYKDLQPVINFLFTDAFAINITTSSVEEHALSTRTVCVPYGRGQQADSCRVTEHLFGDRILRAEPVGSDLSSLAQKTGHLVESVRADVISAWKKWRV